MAYFKVDERAVSLVHLVTGLLSPSGVIVGLMQPPRLVNKITNGIRAVAGNFITTSGLEWSRELTAHGKCPRFPTIDHDGKYQSPQTTSGPSH